MTILITGSTGFIGISLLESLTKNHQVFGLTRSQKKDSKFITTDLLDYEATEKTVLSVISKADIIIQLASKMSDPSNGNDLSILFDNITMSRNVFLLAKKLGVCKLINFSSNAVYPNIDGLYSEESVIDPSLNTDCIYGLSKYNSEVLLKNWLQRENIILTNLRISQVYGKGMNQDRIMPKMEQELNNTNTITVFGDGERVINITSLEFLIEKVELFVEKDLPGIFNIGEKNISLLEIAEEIISQKGNRDSKIIKTSSGNRSRFYIDTKKLNTLLK